MQNTLDIFSDRRAEIEFYFSVMFEIENSESNIHITDTSRFYKIMKSNLLLMLYNLVEACIVSGMLEIYEDLRTSHYSYNQVISKIQKVWYKHKIKEIYTPTTERKTYENRVQEIIDNITTNQSIVISKNALDISGNLDAKKIKDICDKHGIHYRLTSKGESLERVKRDRNQLAHGDLSFSDCAKDLTIIDLENIKNEVISFLKEILDGMKNYYDQKLYKATSS
ncbi:MAE_28990/MAE_18760 family HEPN-like nuclease [Selenomonas noxia]|jgi:hypothetical protein|uniref:MAE_28990/MAE_18760 family HEPN-like nuclease n=1 Tax=Selenomonas noxia TaxID=135083 RepID=UPI0028E7578C|nr:MAE_28990/MAE_18760 family HEPN-like nuclease [Selenomonas noxia]